MESNISLMTIGVLLLGAVFPVALIMTWVYFRDRLREPVSVVVITMTLGGVMVVPILVVQAGLVLFFGLQWGIEQQTVAQALILAFIVAAVVEESFKFGVLRLYSARHDAFDEPFDGIVYGVAASLGFALVENVMYVVGSMVEGGFAGGAVVAVLRSLSAVPMHASCGVIMGACIGLSHFSKGVWWTVFGVILAVVIHGAYDSLLMTAVVPDITALEDGGVSGLLCLGAFATVLFVLGIAGVVVAIFRRKQLASMSEIETVPLGPAGTSMAIPPTPTSDEALPSGAAAKPIEDVPRRLPVGPMITLGLAVLGAGLPILGVIGAVIAVVTTGGASDGVGVFVALSFIFGWLASLAVLPLSIITICIQPRWRAGSILSLVISVGMLLLVPLLVLAAASD